MLYPKNWAWMTSQALPMPGVHHFVFQPRVMALDSSSLFQEVGWGHARAGGKHPPRHVSLCDRLPNLNNGSSI